MAFRDIDQRLIDECIKDTVDLEKVKAFIAGGADVNAYDDEYKQCMYEEILDHYTFEGREQRLNLSNLYQITKIFADNRLILNPQPEDSDCCLLNQFRFLPPEKICIDALKVLLTYGNASFEELDGITTNATLDLHLGEYYFFERKQFYSRGDSIEYYLELIYWACAYSVKAYPEKCSEDLLEFRWFERERNKIELVRENRSTSVFIEDLITHQRTEIDGWTMKY